MNIRNLWKPRFVRDGNYRFTWGEIDFHFHLPRVSIANWNDNHSTLIISLLFACLYINIPRVGKHVGFGNDDSFGFYFYDDALVLQWGQKTKFLHYPWAWRHYKTWALAKGFINKMVWVEIPGGILPSQVAHKETAPYTYTLKNGEIQKRTATYFVDRREWRWRWLMWLPWPHKTRTSIDVEFDDEVGERTGSWKGGCIGCSYDMNKGELPLETLRRMERERVFK